MEMRRDGKEDTFQDGTYYNTLKTINIQQEKLIKSFETKYIQIKRYLKLCGHIINSSCIAPRRDNVVKVFNLRVN